jgi:hypothetical protein
MNPVTALWIIAIPLMDMIAIMYRRSAQRDESVLGQTVSIFTI